MTDLNATKLTPKVKRWITKDWAPFFPGLGVYKPMRFLRRVGPIMIGVCLDRGRGGEHYYPKFHISCLTNDTADLPLTLCTQLQNERFSEVQGRLLRGPDFIAVKWHHRHYEDAAKRMNAQALLPLTGGLSCHQVIAAYRAYGSRQPHGLGLHEHREMPEIAAWAGDQKLALSLFQETVRHIDGYEPRLRKNMEPWRDTPVTAEQWLAELEERLANPEELRAAVERRIDELKLRNLPSAPLLHSVEG